MSDMTNAIALIVKQISEIADRKIAYAIAKLPVVKIRDVALIVSGMYATLDLLIAAHPVGKPGEAYSVGTDNSHVVYVWDTETLKWIQLKLVKTM